MHYFRAVAAERTLVEFRDLVTQYYRALPTGGQQSESKESARLREQIQRLLPEVQDLAPALGIGTIVTVGSGAAGYVHLDALAAVTTRPTGLYVVPRDQIFDLLTRLIGAAGRERRRARWRLVIPIYWLVDVPALVLRFPFLVLRAAGLPSEIERSLAARVVMVMELLALIGLAAWVGWDHVLALLGRK